MNEFNVDAGYIPFGYLLNARNSCPTQSFSGRSRFVKVWDEDQAFQFAFEAFINVVRFEKAIVRIYIEVN